LVLGCSSRFAIARLPALSIRTASRHCWHDTWHDTLWAMKANRTYHEHEQGGYCHHDN
jgi:hypothetical protein